MAPSRAGNRHLQHLAVLGLFLVLSLALGYPLVSRFATHVPGSATWAFDEYTFVWNTWWFKQASVNFLTNPLHTDLLFFPLGIDLILHTYNLFNALVALPLQMVMGLPAASNLTLVLSTILSGYGTYLLVRYQLGASGQASDEASSGSPPSPWARDLAALVAGLIYAFAANRAIYAAMGHYDMVTTQWLPFYVLYLLKTVHSARRRKNGSESRRPKAAGRWSSITGNRVVRHGVLAGLFFTLAVLAEMIFGVFLGVLTLIVLACELWRPKGRPRPRLSRLLLGLVIVGITVAVLWSPVLLPIGREFATGEYALEGWGDAIKLSSDLVGLFTPTALHPLRGGEWVQELRSVEEASARFSDVNTVFLGYVTLALALLGLWRHRGRVRVWAVTTLVFGLFCLGPLLQINGRYRFDLDGLEFSIPLPYALLHYIPIVQANRAPNRNSVLLMLGLAVLAGYGILWLVQRIRGDGAEVGMESAGSLRAAAGLRFLHGRSLMALTVALLLAAAILFEHAAVPVPLTEASVPPVYEQIRAEPGEFAVMQLPLGWRTSFGPIGSERTQIEYYQTVHGKPIIGGNIARSPAFKMGYFGRIPLFQALTGLEMYREPDPETDAAARRQAASLMQLYDVRYLVMLPPIEGRWPYQDTYARTWEYARDVLPLETEPFYEQDGVIGYRVLQPDLVLPLELDLGTAAALPNRGVGWHDDEVIFGDTANWAADTSVELFFPLREMGEYRLSLRIAPFGYPGAPPQAVQGVLNGQPLGEPQSLTDGWQVIELSLSPESVRFGVNRLRLEFSWVERPRDVLSADMAIGTTGLAVPVDIEIAAAADHAYISLENDAGERTDASSGRRGYNIAVIDPHSGRLLDKRGFDTFANEYEAQRLAEFIRQIPEGHIVAVATKGDAGLHLTEEAALALKSLGGQADLQGIAGQAHALIGVQGASAGSGVESVAEASAWVRRGRNPDRRTLGAAVDWVSIGR